MFEQKSLELTNIDIHKTTKHVKRKMIMTSDLAFMSELYTKHQLIFMSERRDSEKKLLNDS